ncbi:MAG: hypothetical protein ABL888_18010 [Pirellulaceae bacterium]
MKKVWHIASDLMMSSTVKVAATRNNFEYRAIPNLTKLTEESVPADVIAIMVDLQAPGLNFESLKSLLDSTDPSVVVCLYAQHVEEEMLARGHSLGRGQLMTRGQFNRDVEKVLAAAQSQPQA